MNDLPICKYRTILPTNEIHCAHSMVHFPRDIVTENVCRHCIWFNTPCENTKPVPELEFEVQEDKPINNLDINELNKLKIRLKLHIDRYQGQYQHLNNQLTQSSSSCNCLGSNKLTAEQIQHIEKQKKTLLATIDKYTNYLNRLS